MPPQILPGAQVEAVAGLGWLEVEQGAVAACEPRIARALAGRAGPAEGAAPLVRAATATVRRQRAASGSSSEGGGGRQRERHSSPSPAHRECQGCPLERRRRPRRLNEKGAGDWP